VLIAQGDGQAPDDLKPTVQTLVRRLDAAELSRRDAAEAELIRLGPKVLDLLPKPTGRTAAETKQRIQRIRQTLQRMAAESAAEASRVSIRGDAIPLSKLLEAISSQTGNKIVDFRERFGHPQTDPPLKVDFDKTPFWEALDTVLDQAELTVYPFGPERAIHVVGRPETHQPRCATAAYSGPLRFEAVDIIARRGLRDPSEQVLQLKLEVAWEPRLAPIVLKQRLSEVKAVDEQGRPLALDERQAEREVPVDADSTAVELPVPLVLPPREVKQIAKLSGTLRAVLPGRIATFRFDNLIRAKNVRKRIAGATVTLEQVRKNNEIWEVWVRVRFDEAGDALQSHRAWIFNNEAYLEGPDGKRIDHDGFETTRRTETEVGLAYLFDLEGPPTQHKFVYKTPSVILSTEFKYELRGIKLP
jgi:PAS domain-containing protein